MIEPKIRFKGFEGEWKAPLFSEMVERISASGQAGMLPGVEFEDIASGEGCFNKNIYQKECHKYGKLFYEGDILFGKLRPYLKNIIFADFNGVAIGDFWVLRSKGLDEKYLYTLVNSESFLKVANISSGSKMPRADWNLVSTTKFVVPSAKDEQKAIGKYFTSLDSQISASTSRLASLKQMKAASLQAMFPQEGETVPKIRFKGFEGEWKKKLLNECLSVCTEKNFDNIYNKEDVLSVSDDFGICNQIKLLGRSYAGKSVANYGILQTGYIVYTKSPLKAKPYGIIKTNHGPTGIVSTLYAIYAPKKDTNADFIEVYFDHAERLNKYIHPLVNKGAKNDMKVSSENALKGFIMIPSLAEQQAIASYFTSLDRQISLQSQRLEKLKQIKSACLDKMFV